MTRILFNADDFGYSEAVTLGIIKAHQDGLIRTTTMMTNMDAAPMAAQLAKANPQLYVGQHSNVVVGRPCSDPLTIPSLVDEHGFFNTKVRLSQGLKLDREEIKREVRAQAERFKELMGHYPSHIEGHAIRDTGLFYGIAEVATELNAHFTDVERDPQGLAIKDQHHRGYELPDYPEAAYYMDGVNLDFWLQDWGKMLGKDLVEMHTHPGYVDQYLLDHSSYTLTRCKEVEIACSAALKEWAAANGVEFITFAEIRKI